MSGTTSDSTNSDEIAAYNAANDSGKTGENSGKDMSHAPDNTENSQASAQPDSSGEIKATSVAAGAAAGAATGASVGGVYGAAIGAVVGAGVSIFGQLQSASDQAEIDRKKAEFAQQQADEIAIREQINDAIRGEQTFKAKLDFASEYAASGHEGAGIGSQLEIQRQSDLATVLADRDAAFQEKVIMQGGKLQGQLANITENAGYYNAAGTALTGIGRVLSNPALSSPSSPEAFPSRGAR